MLTLICDSIRGEEYLYVIEISEERRGVFTFIEIS